MYWCHVKNTAGYLEFNSEIHHTVFCSFCRCVLKMDHHCPWYVLLIHFSHLIGSKLLNMPTFLNIVVKCLFLLPEFITSLLRSIKKICLAREHHRRRQDMEFGEESRAGWYCLEQKASRCRVTLQFTRLAQKPPVTQL